MTALALVLAGMLATGCAKPVPPVPQFEQVTITRVDYPTDSLRLSPPDTVWAHGGGQEWRQITQRRYVITWWPDFETGEVVRDSFWRAPIVTVEQVR